MVVEMKKLSLVAMSYDRDEILNTLERTGAVEIKPHAASDFAHEFSLDDEELVGRLTAAENALAVLSSAAQSYASDHKIIYEKDGEVDVSYSDFMAAGQNDDVAQGLVAEVFALNDERNTLKTELNRLIRSLKAARVYEKSTLPFSAYTKTATTVFRLGVVEQRAFDSLQLRLKDVSLADYRLISKTDVCLLAVCFHKSVATEGDKILAEAGFISCPYRDDKTGAELTEELLGKIAATQTALEENGKAFFELSKEISTLKIYCDFLNFELEKTKASDKMLSTDRTVLLEAYVPVMAQDRVQNALVQASKSIYFEFSDVPDDEMPPTLLKNNALVTGFESLTNTYSVPNAREFDPNAVMAIFYSIFLGFIMADAAYGVLMILGGGYIWWKNRKRPTSVSQLASVFAIGGVFAVIWGFLFNSFLGIPLLPLTIMPDPREAMWTFAGIKIPSELIICMLIGVVHLGTGYACKAVQCWRRKEITDGIFDGLIWALFSVGMFLAIMGLIEELHMNIFVIVGGITAGTMLLIAMFTAGRKEKLVGKFTKGFGAAYGIINYVSDILSYARLYGLMLSGAVIANLVSGFAVTGYNGSVGFLVSGNIGLIILGVVLIIVGHIFNLAIGLLGAYIHDARLQYVEFYGKFYEGEGELFLPLGSNKKYVRVL